MIAFITTQENTMQLQTPEQVKQRLRNEGKTIKQFAQDNGFNYVEVLRVMNGTIKGVRGRGHQIAVTLGLKVPGTAD
jgi:gp16 family phage-associated protein